ncbi:MAG: hypothetical protein NTX91_05545 [candidate division SR1 bacterium]|nr:hypothetical protein [candidate division SR1 bacterium]
MNHTFKKNLIDPATNFINAAGEKLSDMKYKIACGFVGLSLFGVLNGCAPDISCLGTSHRINNKAYHGKTKKSIQNTVTYRKHKNH